ncbi:MAG: hypothetical protein M5U15_01565 [Kiritimatiellae bacterium]|nr:hypothetical protein [Kiritimatiellia bacterium]
MRTARPPKAQAGGGNRAAAGGRFGAREADDQRKTAAERPGVQPGRPPTAPGGRRKRPRPSGATHKRRGPAPHLAKPGVQPGAESGSGGLGVPRALPLARGMTSPERMGRTLARGRTTAEGRPRPGAVAPPTTQRSGTPGAAKQGA